jgi:VIT1/CCC1 family predicted Fe2+/Mn2+ transporter
MPETPQAAPQTPQGGAQSQPSEPHFRGSQTVRDVIIGMADGLTVPFALAAGLSGAVATTGIIVKAGLAEIAAGSISMGLGGYLAAKSDAEHYYTERKREEREIVELPEAEAAEVTGILQSFGLDKNESGHVVGRLSKRPKDYVDFMMRFELGLEEPSPRRALISAVTIAGGYVFGGFIPLSPYMVTPITREAVGLSVAVTLAALAVFGYVKGVFTGAKPRRSAIQTVVIGGLAAAAAFAIAKYIA